MRLDVRTHLSAHQPEPEQQADKSLLRPVVEVALEPAALGVPRLDDTRPRSPQIFLLRPQARLKTFILEREARRRSDLVDELGVVEQAGTMDENGHRPALSNERCRRASTLRGDVDDPSIRVDVAVLADRVGDGECGVTDDAGKCIAQTAGANRLAQFHDQPGQRGPRPANPDPSPRDSRRQRDERHRFGQPQSAFDVAGADEPEIETGDEAPSDESEVDDPGQQDRSGEVSPGWARSDETPPDNGDQGDRRHQPESHPGPTEVVDETRVVGDEQ